VFPITDTGSIVDIYISYIDRLHIYLYIYTCVDIIYDVCVADENDIQDTVEDHDSGFEGSYARSRYKCHHGR
jgi:hypothetical protein